MNIQLRIEQIKPRQQDKDRQGKIGRRNIGTGKIAYLIACLVTSVLGLVSFSFSVQAHTDLTVVNWGGDAARAQMLALVRPQSGGKSPKIQFCLLIYLKMKAGMSSGQICLVLTVLIFNCPVPTMC